MDEKKFLPSFKEKISSFLKDDKKTKIIIFLGLLGILLIFFSSITGGKKSQSDDGEKKEVTTTTEYVKRLEDKILDIVVNIQGVGKSKVMVTLENGIEYVYAGEEKTNKDSTEDISGSDSKKIQQKDNYEQKLILVDGPNGSREALIKKQIEPTIKGVIIVCEGGDSPSVQERVVSAITTALNIKSNRVCVIK